MAKEDARTGRNSIELATELTIAWLSNPNVRASSKEVPAFLNTIHAKLGELSNGPEGEAVEPVAEFIPAVSVRRSLASKDHIIAMIDGKSYKTLKRNLAGHGLTPPQYRERYGLKADYPMVAESYAEMRRGLAKKIGLGRKPGTKLAKPASNVTAKPAAKVSTKPTLKATTKPAAKSKAPRP